jgi:hypothetical protein
MRPTEVAELREAECTMLADLILEDREGADICPGEVPCP